MQHKELKTEEKKWSCENSTTQKATKHFSGDVFLVAILSSRNITKQTEKNMTLSWTDLQTQN